MKQRIRPYAAALAVCAAFVGAGCGDDNKDNSASTTDTGTTAATQTETSATTPGAAATTLKISADPSGALKFDKTSLTAKPGKVTIVMANPSSVPHAVEIEGVPGSEGKTVEKGGVSKATGTVKAGTYTYYCPVDGHEAAGMKGTLTVK